jgi:hypothetical protein
MSGLLKRSLGLGLACVLVFAPSANGVGGKSWAPSAFSWGYSRSTHRTYHDAYKVYAYPRWNTAARNALQNLMQQTGWKYTQEQNDYPTDHLNAHGYGVALDWSTNFPNPEHGLDDDDHDQRFEEAEVTANSLSFPTVDYSYFVMQEWSRWRCGQYQGGTCYWWIWDGNSGSIDHLSQMSWWPGWQAADWTDIYAATPYGTQSPPAGASALGDETTAGEITAEARSAFTIHGLSVTVETGGSEADVSVASPSRHGLSEYLAANSDRAKLVLQSEPPFPVVITFARPLDSTEIRTITEIAGIEFGDAEAIGVLPDTTTMTAGGLLGDGQHLLDLIRERDGVPLGIVAVEAIIGTREAYDRLVAVETVFLVDVSPSIVRIEANQSGTLKSLLGTANLDVNVNDVYWLHAGLER